MYLGHWETVDWLGEVARMAGQHPGLRKGAVELFVLPTFPALAQAVRTLSRVGVAVGAQDLFWEDRGPYTGEVSGAELAELGCRYVEVGHLERRRHLGETDEIVAAKTAAAFRNRLTPVICVGESHPGSPDDAADECVRQLEAALRDSRNAGSVGPALVAYEPHWAVGAEAAADASYIRTVCSRLKSVVHDDEDLAGSRVIYGGSAGTGLLAELAGAADGLFLGRASHDPAVLEAVLDEAVAASGR
ncbi:MAG: triose-phosphate isomerase [Actinomycetota bacterium]|nr:triose-phosphate isomerase [Actinomycetota bacterium]